MKIIAVDDERLALEGLVNTIKSIESESEVQGFCNPMEALEYIKKNEADVAFLDIEMFGINGKELAGKMKEIRHDINIIFVTGYSDYAVKAMEIRASGYLLKPARESDVRRELDNLRNPIEIKKEKKVYMQTFGNFEVFIDDEPVKFSRRKSKELLAFLVDRKGAGVSSAEIAAVLWEDKEYTRSLKNQVQTIVGGMMDALKAKGAQDIIIKKWNSLSIDISKIECDYYKFLEGDVAYINKFAGEYMSNYSWSEFTAGYLTDKVYSGTSAIN